MRPDDFNLSMQRASVPPPGLTAAQEALWWCQKGEWERAHQCVQSDESREGAWVHAHLHRVEGDLGNAAYWYRRAGRPVFSGEAEVECAAIIAELMKPSV